MGDPLERRFFALEEAEIATLLCKKGYDMLVEWFMIVDVVRRPRYLKT